MGPSIKHVTLQRAHERGGEAMGPHIKYVTLQREGDDGDVHKVCHTTVTKGIWQRANVGIC
jgi:hypothetical protein